MAIDSFRKRAAVAGVAVPTNPGVQPDAVPSAFYRSTIAYSYLPTAVPPGGQGTGLPVTVLGGHAVLGDRSTTALGGIIF